MAPETRARGVPPPSRVYHASPPLQQIQFPSRRKKIRRHADAVRRRELKQQTLTQIEFVSSFEEDPEEGGGGVSAPSGDDREDEQLTRPGGDAGKRRRAVCDEDDDDDDDGEKTDPACRLGGTSGARYHTQTLTQLLGTRTSIVADSDSEADGDEDGFLSWLGQADPASPSAGRATHRREPVPRSSSVVPQTPTRQGGATTRSPPPPPPDTSPPPTMSDPQSAMVARYGPPDVQDSPLKERRGRTRRRHASPVMEDSVTTGGSSQPRVSCTPSSSRGAPATAGPRLREEIPDSEAENSDDDDDAGATAYRVGVETQALMGELASAYEPSEKEHEEHEERASDAASSSSSSSSSPIRDPIPHHHQPGQPWESQRVPLSELQALPGPSPRSDILLPISSASLRRLLSGHAASVATPFGIPPHVVRFWFLERRLLRYMASVEPGLPQPAPSRPAWRFPAPQVYELNNPVREQDMRHDGWLAGPVSRYAYLPPAVVGHLLWNLRHALFAHPSSPSSPSPPSSRPSSPPLSQQLSAQINTDMLLHAHSPTSPLLQSHPSQATTLSQTSTSTSTPESPRLLSAPVPVPVPSPPHHQSSINFPSSLSSMPLPSSRSSSTSQLLTKSQLLPDSLTRELAPTPLPEIWDSDDDGDDVPL